MSPKLNHFSIGGYMKPKSKGWGFKTEIDMAGLLFTNQYGGIFNTISTQYGGVFGNISTQLPGVICAGQQSNKHLILNHFNKLIKTKLMCSKIPTSIIHRSINVIQRVQ